MTDDHQRHVQLGQHSGSYLAGERPLVFPVAVLGTESDRNLVGLEHRLNGPEIGERRMHRYVDRIVVVRRQHVRQLLYSLDGLEVVVMHLPVPADQRLALGHGYLPICSTARRSVLATKCSQSRQVALLD